MQRAWIGYNDQSRQRSIRRRIKERANSVIRFSVIEVLNNKGFKLSSSTKQMQTRYSFVSRFAIVWWNQEFNEHYN